MRDDEFIIQSWSPESLEVTPTPKGSGILQSGVFGCISPHQQVEGSRLVTPIGKRERRISADLD